MILPATPKRVSAVIGGEESVVSLPLQNGPGSRKVGASSEMLRG